MPFAGTKVIPPGWSDHHRPVAAGTMTATCNLRLPGVTSGSFNSTSGTQGGTPNTPYLTGAKCRLQAQSIGEKGVEHLVADQQVTTMLYLVAIDWSTGGAVEPAVGHLVDVVTAEDATMVGRTLTVKAVVRGSLVWERDLICTDDLG